MDLFGFYYTYEKRIEEIGVSFIIAQLYNLPAPKPLLPTFFQLSTKKRKI